MLAPVSYNNQLTFGVNLKSPKLRLSQKDFFIKIRGYGKDTNWANEILKTTDEAVKLIRDNWDSDWVLFNIAQGVKQANQYPFDLELRQHTGVLRTKRVGWESGSSWDGCVLTTPYKGNKYRLYAERLDKVSEKDIANPYNDIKLARTIKSTKEIYHPAPDFINNAFEKIEKIFKIIQENFIKKEAKKTDIEAINNYIAEIRWILAHSMPWERGSDCISNVFMRAIYKAIGIKAYPPAKSVSYDLEAFCTNLDEYKRNFPKYFEKPPEIIE